MAKYAAFGVILGVIGGLALSFIINDHFDEMKCYRGKTINTEVPCR